MLPPVTIDEEEPQLESDAYLESLLTEDLSDVDDIDAKDDDDMAWGSRTSYLVHCLLFWTFFFMSGNFIRQILNVVWQWSLNSWCQGHIIFYVINYINITSVFQSSTWYLLWVYVIWFIKFIILCFKFQCECSYESLNLEISNMHVWCDYDIIPKYPY